MSEFSKLSILEQRVFNNAAEKVGAALEKAGNDLAKLGQEISQEITNVFPDSYGDRLKKFKEELGDDCDKILASENFVPLFNQWEEEQKEKNTSLCVKIIRDKLPEDTDVTKQDIYMFLLCVQEYSG